MHLKKGTSLRGGEYVIESVLGEGGFGITYLAWQTALNRKVAIKEFFLDGYCNRDEVTSQVNVPSVTTREQVARCKDKFVKEAQIIAGLNHPNIIRVISVFEENETAYYVMDHVEGGSLEQLSNPGSPMSEAVAKDYICQVADALKYLHDNNILHLDVKPSNILARDGKAVLIDFGISKRYDSVNGEQTSMGPIVFSDGYAPLEQYTKDGVAHFTPATDIYSLGATLYKLVTGCRPANAGDLVTMENGLSIPVSVSVNVERTIRASMKPAIGQRPQSIAEFMDLLFKCDAPAPAPVPPPLTRVQHKKKGGAWKWIFISLAVIAAILAAVWGYGKYRESVIEKKVDRYLRKIAYEWRDDDASGALDALVEYGEWYAEQSSKDQAKVDEYEIEWCEDNIYENALLDDFWEYMEDEEILEESDDYDLYDLISDPDVQDFALDLLEEIF